MNFQLRLVVILKPLKVQGHKVPHWKALSSGKYETRGLNCDNTLNIYQDVLKSANLPQIQGFVDTQTTVPPVDPGVTQILFVTLKR